MTETKRSSQLEASPAAPHEGPIIYPALTGDEPSWFALYVQVNHEKEVSRRLEQKSIEAFLPLMESWSRRQDRRKKIHTPLFPGYVFVHAVLDNYTNMHILKTPGALNILRNSEGALPIPNYQIENLQTMLGSRETLDLHPYLKDGDWVRVLRGPLRGCVGLLMRQNPRKGRLVVSIDLIQKSVSVELNVEDVEPISPPAEGIVRL